MTNTGCLANATNRFEEGKMNDGMIKRTIRASRILAILIAGIFSISVWAQPPSAVDFTVNVFPRPDGTVEIETGPQGNGAAGKGRGYMGYGHNEAGWTTFQIRGQNPFLTCADDDGNGPSPWVITGLRLSDSGENVFDSQKGTTQQRGTDFGSPVDDFVWQSFMLVDRNDGVLFEADKDTTQSFLQVYNYNAHEVPGPRLVYYELELTRCRDGHTATADPAWQNDGKNSP
jgi:hypothetical protein